MLYRFLRAMQRSEMHSLLGVAHALGLSPDMAQQIALDLTARGYLWEAGADCDTPRNACGDCPVTSACHIPTRYWSLTEKGRHALEMLEKTQSAT